MVNIESSMRGSTPKIIVLDGVCYWTQQLFSQYQSTFDILFLNPKNNKQFKDLYGKYFIDLHAYPVDNNIWEQRICFPPGWMTVFWGISEKVLSHCIRDFTKDSPCLLVCSYPHYYKLAQALRIPAVYYNFDDYQYYWPRTSDKIISLEQEAIINTDITICTAKYRTDFLKECFPDQAKKIFHLPNGCTPMFMVSDALSSPLPLPSDISYIKRPIAGYIGTLRSGFDFDYFLQVAQELPDISFVLGGHYPKKQDGNHKWWMAYQELRKLNNIHFIGEVKHEQLGDFLQSFDVLLTCYSKSGFNMSICPTKLWDYMGTSRPIVSNNTVPEINLWKEVILIANSPEEYSKNIRFAIRNPNWLAKERLEIAKNHTWDKLSLRLFEFLKERGIVPLS